MKIDLYSVDSTLRTLIEKSSVVIRETEIPSIYQIGKDKFNNFGRGEYLSLDGVIKTLNTMTDEQILVINNDLKIVHNFPL